MRLLLKACDELKSQNLLNQEIVLAGRKGWKLNEVVGEMSAVKSYVHITGFIDDEDLPLLYKHADMFVFPSTYEGFGIPIIEAMSQGTIVLSSNSSSLPEIVGDGGVLFENNDVNDLKAKIIDMLNYSMEEKEQLVLLGRKNVERFQWAKEAEKFCDVIKMCYKERQV
jgi:glycosyltransferase involved in cell wall biosynthesis